MYLQLKCFEYEKNHFSSERNSDFVFEQSIWIAGASSSDFHVHKSAYSLLSLLSVVLIREKKLRITLIFV